MFIFFDVLLCHSPAYHLIGNCPCCYQSYAVSVNRPERSIAPAHWLSQALSSFRQFFSKSFSLLSRVLGAFPTGINHILGELSSALSQYNFQVFSLILQEFSCNV